MSISLGGCWISSAKSADPWFLSMIRRVCLLRLGDGRVELDMCAVAAPLVPAILRAPVHFLQVSCTMMGVGSSPPPPHLPIIQQTLKLTVVNIVGWVLRVDDCRDATCDSCPITTGDLRKDLFSCRTLEPRPWVYK
eukprot:632366-Hanusia_phi.AAC.1